MRHIFNLLKRYLILMVGVLLLMFTVSCSNDQFIELKEGKYVFTQTNAKEDKYGLSITKDTYFTVNKIDANSMGDLSEGQWQVYENMLITWKNCIFEGKGSFIQIGTAEKSAVIETSELRDFLFILKPTRNKNKVEEKNVKVKIDCMIDSASNVKETVSYYFEMI
ncbi:MAG: hypothetical protein K2I42_03365 [Anaeroplasmataceae bacterium]|nr:hypothetical protein [Anaeroplasmataceae bacterium]